MAAARRLYRTRSRVVAGICGGVAEYFGLSASRVRLAAVLMLLLGGLSLWAYLVMWLVVPNEPNRLNS